LRSRKKILGLVLVDVSPVPSQEKANSLITEGKEERGGIAQAWEGEGHSWELVPEKKR